MRIIYRKYFSLITKSYVRSSSGSKLNWLGRARTSRQDLASRDGFPPIFVLLEGGKISNGIFRIAKCSLSYIQDMIRYLYQFLGLGRHYTFRNNFLFFFFHFFFWRRNLFYRFHSSSFFFWNSVRIWFWMIPNGLIHQCPGIGSCSVVKKVTMSEKKYK